jgi:hypothetical protein
MEGSTTLVARIIYVVEEFGAWAGAVYKPFPEMIPRVSLPPSIPLTLQITPESTIPATFAVY